MPDRYSLILLLLYYNRYSLVRLTKEILKSSILDYTEVAIYVGNCNLVMPLTDTSCYISVVLVSQFISLSNI